MKRFAIVVFDGNGIESTRTIKEGEHAARRALRRLALAGKAPGASLWSLNGKELGEVLDSFDRAPRALRGV